MSRPNSYAVVIFAGDHERIIHTCQTKAEATFKRDQLRERQAIIRQIEDLERDPRYHAPRQAPLRVGVKRLSSRVDLNLPIIGVTGLAVWVWLAHLAGGIQ